VGYSVPRPYHLGESVRSESRIASGIYLREDQNHALFAGGIGAPPRTPVERKEGILDVAIGLILLHELGGPGFRLLLVGKLGSRPGVLVHGPGRFELAGLDTDVLELAMYDEATTANRVKVSVNEVATALALVDVFKLCGVCWRRSRGFIVIIRYWNSGFHVAS